MTEKTGFQVGDMIKFPKAQAERNRDRAYQVEKVHEDGSFHVSADGDGGGIFYYPVSAEEAKSMGMKHV